MGVPVRGNAEKMRDESVYDVAIIGGGLAGLSLAIQCANEGFNVVLFEKEIYPFHKVCGEYISLESQSFLQRIGFDVEKLNLPLINALQLSDVKGMTYNFDLPLGGFGISRYALDYSLFTMAGAKGVTIFTNTKVRDVNFADGIFSIEASEIIARSKVVAGAYGKRSNLDLKWKRPFASHKANSLNNYIGIKYHVNYGHQENTIALHNFHNGYCGFSGIEDGKSCLCYLTTAENLKQCGNSIEEMQRSILYRNPKLKEIFSSAEFLYDTPLAISHISFRKKLQVENRVLMLGDAAGMISPLCGNGMSMAMHSSKIAFDCTRFFLTGRCSRDEMEKRYTAEWNKAFSKRVMVGRSVQRFFGGDTATSFFLKTMHAIPSLARFVIQSTHGTSF
jgi:flavin-dependent dehydrogenase